jgi:DNA repair exonuclease SbcCD ATPase subunit
MDEMERIIVLLQELLQFTIKTINTHGGLEGLGKTSTTPPLAHSSENSPSANKIKVIQEEIQNLGDDKLPKGLKVAFIKMLDDIENPEGDVKGSISSLLTTITSQIKPVTTLTNELEKDGADLTQLQGQIENLMKIVNVVKGYFKIDGEIQKYGDVAIELQNDLTSIIKLKKDLETAQTTIIRLEDEKEVAGKAKEEAEARESTLKEEKGKIQEQLQAAQQELAAAKLVEAPAENEDAAKKAIEEATNPLQAQITDLTAKLTDKEVEITKVNQVKDEATARVMELQGALTAATEKVEELGRKLADANTALKETEEAKGKLEGALAEKSKTKKRIIDVEPSDKEQELQGQITELERQLSEKPGIPVNYETIKQERNRLLGEKGIYLQQIQELQKRKGSQITKTLQELESNLQQKQATGVISTDLQHLINQKELLIQQLQWQIQQQTTPSTDKVELERQIKILKDQQQENLRELSKARSEVAEKKQLENQLLTISSELNDAKAKASSLNATKDERNAAREEIAILIGEKEESERKLKKIEEDATKFYADFEVQKKELQKQLDASIEEATQKQQTLLAELEAAKKSAENASKTQKIAANVRVAELQGQLDELKRKHEDEKQVIQQRTATSIGSVSASAQEAIKAKEEEISRIQGILRAKEDEYASALARIQAEKQAVEKQKNEYAGKFAEGIASIQQKAEVDKKAALAAKEAEIKTLQDKLKAATVLTGDFEVFGGPSRASGASGSLSTSRLQSSPYIFGTSNDSESLRLPGKVDNSSGAASGSSGSAVSVRSITQQKSKGAAAAATLSEEEINELLVKLYNGEIEYNPSPSSISISAYKSPKSPALTDEQRKIIGLRIEDNYNKNHKPLIDAIVNNFGDPKFTQTSKGKLRKALETFFKPTEWQYKYRGIFLINSDETNDKFMKERVEFLKTELSGHLNIQKYSNEIFNRMMTALTSGEKYKLIDFTKDETIPWKPDALWSLATKSMFSGVASTGVTRPFQLAKGGAQNT